MKANMKANKISSKTEKARIESKNNLAKESVRLLPRKEMLIEESTLSLQTTHNSMS
jgi:hypothetical protein